jgi:phage shock protein PspC (stress-responsive transcriptional regulator)
MNKTVTINISGIIFHIEEDAYDKLSKYLNTIKGYFTSNESGSEIIADIEARIAELLQAKVSQFKQVVLMADVDEVINALGKPEEFVDGETTSNSNSSKQNESSASHATGPVKRRLFRDPDEKAIGGVCAGIAHYFDIDIVWIRLATFLLVFFGGVSLWVYAILWIVIPQARTTADRLAMRGEAVNIDNISKSIKDEMDGVKNRFNSYGKEAAQTTRTGLDRVGDVIAGLFRIAGRLLGAFLIFFAFMLMFGLVSSIFGFSIAGESAEFNDWINIIFLDRSHYWMAFIGGIIAVGVPAFMILYGGIKLLFKIKYSNRWLNIGAGILWIFGVILATYAGIKTGSDFSEGSKYKESMTVKGSAEVFTISALPSTKLLEKHNIEELNDDDDDDRRHHDHDNNYSICELNGKKVIVGVPEVRVITGSGDEIEVIINRKARGKEKRMAYERAKAINFNHTLDSTSLVLDGMFYLDEDQKFRVQQIEVIVKVPKGRTIYLDPSLKNISFDIDNSSTHTYDQDMLSRRWKMNDRELECVDCAGLENKKKKHHDFEKDHVRINDDGIEVKDKDGNLITIDEDGVNVNSENGDVKVKKKAKREDND